MLSNGSQLTKKDNALRKRKSLIAGAGVKHRINFVPTLSALHSHSSSCSIKRKRSINFAMSSNPMKSTAKKKQEKYVIQMANQQFMQQFSKSGTSVMVKDEDTEDLTNLTLQQKIRVFFILLMIPSAMYMFFGKDKFNSNSGSTIDPNIQLSRLGAFGGHGGIPGAFGGHGGFPGAYGGGIPDSGYDGRSDRRNFHQRMKRHPNPLPDGITRY